MYKKRIAFAITVLAIFSAMMFVIPEPVKGCKFILASWTYPDDYGQGIHSISAYTNASGSWVSVDGINWLSSSNVILWNQSNFIRLYVGSSVNKTLLSLSTPEEGANYIKHNVTVVDSFGVEVFSQQNFTLNWAIYDAGYAIDLYYYSHYVTLGFAPIDGQTYTVTLTCAIWW